MYCTLVVMLLSIVLVGCNGSGGGSDKAKVPAAVVTYDISDSTFTDIKVKNGKLINDSEIQCIEGQNLVIDIEVNVHEDISNHVINAKCNNDLEFNIRKKLVSSFVGRFLLKESGRRKPSTMVGVLDFYTNSFTFDIPYMSLVKVGWQGAAPNHQSRCYLDYVFSEDGTVSMGIANQTGQTWIDSEDSNYNHMIYGDHIPRDSNNNIGCLTAVMELSSGHYRYNNEKLEIDESGTRRFAANGCGKWDGETFELLDYKENGDGNGNCPDVGYETTLERFKVDLLAFI